MLTHPPFFLLSSSLWRDVATLIEPRKTLKETLKKLHFDPPFCLPFSLPYFLVLQEEIVNSKAHC